MSQPTIGIIVPSYNAARFLGDALDSILGQDYPHLHCLVMDGGSTDATVDLLRSYGDAIEWVSEPDEGQSDAIERGFRRLSADLVGWLNADDRLLPGALATVADTARRRPDAVLLHGDVEMVDEFGRLFGLVRSVDLDHRRLKTAAGRVVQPGSFYRREAVEACGGVNREFHLLMDLDLWIRLLQHGTAARIPARLAQFRVHDEAKSSVVPYRYYRETLRIFWRHDRDRPLMGFARRAFNISLHFVRWKLGLRVNDREPLPPARIPPMVSFAPGTIESAQRQVLSERDGIQWSAPDRGRPTDLAIRRLPPRGPTDETVPIVWVADQFPPEGDVRWTELLDRAGFVVAPPHAVDPFVECGVPGFRIGAADDSDVWSRAVAVALGTLPFDTPG